MKKATLIFGVLFLAACQPVNKKPVVRTTETTVDSSVSTYYLIGGEDTIEIKNPSSLVIKSKVEWMLDSAGNMYLYLGQEKNKEINIGSVKTVNIN